MPYQLNDKEYAAVLSLAAPERYRHFVNRVADCEEVWTLTTADGFILAGDDAGRELAPVWPHPRYAAACATGNWEGAEPSRIPMDKWRERWLPGMERDDRWAAVFPTPDNHGVAVEASRLAADLVDELARCAE